MPRLRLEGSDVIEAGVDAVELETSGPVAATSLARNKMPGTGTRSLDGQEQVRPALGPNACRQEDAGAGTMSGHGDGASAPSPGVKHRGDGDAGAEALGIGAMVVMVSAEA